MSQNKIYVCEGKIDHFLGTSFYVIVVAASDIDTARNHVKETIGIDVGPVYLMGASYPLIWPSSGPNPLDVQAKILYNGNVHFN